MVAWRTMVADRGWRYESTVFLRRICRGASGGPAGERAERARSCDEPRSIALPKMTFTSYFYVGGIRRARWRARSPAIFTLGVCCKQR